MSGSSSSRGVNLIIIDSRRGGKTLLRAGHKYIKRRENKNSSTWHCVNRRNSIKCSGYITIENTNNTIIKDYKHSDQCVPHFEDNEVQIAISECKKEVNSNYGSVQKIFEKHMGNLKDKGLHLTGNVPDYKKLKTVLYRHRNKSLNVPKTQFKNVEEIIILEEFNKYVLADYCNEDCNRIIIFSSTEVKEHIKCVTHYFGDGTFDGCPNPFEQVYVIHGDMGSTELSTNVAPLFYILLKNKEGKTYEKVFELIKQTLPEWRPSKFTFDYEIGVINAAAKIFPDIKINGCNVHFQKNVIKKAKSLNLMEHEESSNHVKQCIRLAFLPKQDIEDGWLHIMENSFDDEAMTKFNDYFVTQWLEYPDLIWCCHNERHRTTNLAESWNGRFNKIIGKNPSLLLFLQTIGNDTCHFDIKQAK
ncbi:hypothetical protein HF086_008098 [Spodoptera exigua]|uniref:FLYWCH-type domain-containing protein n=1 Tax=Spodoptera exigua TaxID=7107 RepID=A0A922MP13_SPOEX|nr:hypothetical protein HF086_008098 [Spodoptera exigua]